MLFDMISLLLSFALAVFTYNVINDSKIYSIFNSACFSMALFIEIANIAIFFIFGTLKNVLKRGYTREFIYTFRHVLIVVLIALLYSFNFSEIDNSLRISLCIMAPLYLVITYTVRVIWKIILKRISARSAKRTLLLVTTSDIAFEVIENIKNNNFVGFNIIGLATIDCDMVGHEINGVKIVANKETVSEYVCRGWVDEVFVNVPYKFDFPHELVNDFVITGVTVHLNIEDLYDTLGGKRLVEKVGNYNVLTTSINYATIGQAFLKRALDICGGIVGAFLTGIIYLFLAPAIYIKSPGPIFFSQERVGKNGKKFKIYKFRSMYLDAEDRKQELKENNRVKDGMMFKVDFDERIIGNKILPDGTHKTGIGDFIRRTSLDEFPQFINVLKGEMSLVGTRPPTLDEWEKYELHHRARLATKPGITGMWQVSGRSKITDFEEVVKLDTKYITEWDFKLDIKILLKTIVIVLKQDGSM